MKKLCDGCKSKKPSACKICREITEISNRLNNDRRQSEILKDLNRMQHLVNEFVSIKGGRTIKVQVFNLLKIFWKKIVK